MTIKNKESLGISNIVRKLIVFYIGDIQKLSVDIQDSYLDELTRLTCSFCKGAALEDGVCNTNFVFIFGKFYIFFFRILINKSIIMMHSII